MAGELPAYLFTDEAAEYLRVDVSTIYRWVRSGQIRGIKVGQRWRVARAELDAMLAGK